MMYYADESRGKRFAKDPAVVAYRGKYWMFYSAPPFGDGREDDGWNTAVATSTDLDNWTKLGDVKKPSELERKGFCAPGAIVIDDKIHLFYQTYGGWRNDAICHATTTDGINLTPNPTNPIFRPHGDWNCGRAIDADVIPWNDRLVMAVATRDPDMKIQKLAIADAPLDSDFARDKWTQLVDKSILEPVLPWEGECIEAPAFIKHNGKLFMFYAGAYNNWPQQIGCAVTTDCVNWKRVSDSPVLPNGKPGEWNSSESGHPFAFQAPDGSQHLFFQGNNDKGKSWFISRKSIRWNGDVPYFV